MFKFYWKSLRKMFNIVDPCLKSFNLASLFQIIFHILYLTLYLTNSFLKFSRLVSHLLSVTVGFHNLEVNVSHFYFDQSYFILSVFCYQSKVLQNSILKTIKHSLYSLFFINFIWVLRFDHFYFILQLCYLAHYLLNVLFNRLLNLLNS